MEKKNNKTQTTIILYVEREIQIYTEIVEKHANKSK